MTTSPLAWSEDKVTIGLIVIGAIIWFFIFPNYWVCIFTILFILFGATKIVKWANQSNLIDNSDKLKGVLFVYLALCFLICFSTYKHIMAKYSQNPSQVCGTVTSIIKEMRFLSKSRSSYRDYTIKVDDNNAKMFEFVGYRTNSPPKKDSEVCINYIAKEKSIFIPKNLILSLQPNKE